MRGKFSPYIAVARPRAKHTATKGPAAAGKQPAKTDPEQLKEIRRWAHAHGLEFSDRGRIPKHVQAVYDAMAHKTNGSEVPKFSSTS